MDNVTPKRNPYDWKRCSEEFADAFFAGIGTIIATCACGRTHFSDCGDHEPSELERLLEQAKAEPDRYINTSESAILLTDLGPVYVRDCPCGGEARHEGWIWTHREQIAKYLRSRVAKELKEAQDAMTICVGLPSVPPTNKE